jgi:hypothetical protein
MDLDGQAIPDPVHGDGNDEISFSSPGKGDFGGVPTADELED